MTFRPGLKERKDNPDRRESKYKMGTTEDVTCRNGEMSDMAGVKFLCSWVAGEVARCTRL